MGWTSSSTVVMLLAALGVVLAIMGPTGLGMGFGQQGSGAQPLTRAVLGDKPPSVERAPVRAAAADVVSGRADVASIARTAAPAKFNAGKPSAVLRRPGARAAPPSAQADVKLLARQQDVLLLAMLASKSGAKN